MKKSTGRTAFLGAVALLVLLVCAVVYFPTAKKEAPPKELMPVRDDVLASRFLPVFDCPDEYGPILAIYYRASRDAAGLTHIAYHPAWARERNTTKAWGPFLSRWLYTGGLSLQRAMFGIGDIESIGLTLNPSQTEVLEIEYETAADYNPANFGVRHLKVQAKGPFTLPLVFRVVSWNHLFAFETGAAGKPTTAAAAPLSYFTPELWAKYAMWKNPETILRKDRAHFVWERAVNQ
jgi:hypothetical protein